MSKSRARVVLDADELVEDVDLGNDRPGRPKKTILGASDADDLLEEVDLESERPKRFRKTTMRALDADDLLEGVDLEKERPKRPRKCVAKASSVAEGSVVGLPAPNTSHLKSGNDQELVKVGGITLLRSLRLSQSRDVSSSWMISISSERVVYLARLDACYLRLLRVFMLQSS